MTKTLSWRLVSLLSLLGLVRTEELTVRLSGGRYLEAGYLEVWREGRWGAMCVDDAGERYQIRPKIMVDMVEW